MSSASRRGHVVGSMQTAAASIGSPIVDRFMSGPRSELHCFPGGFSCQQSMLDDTQSQLQRHARKGTWRLCAGGARRPAKSRIRGVGSVRFSRLSCDLSALLDDLVGRSGRWGRGRRVRRFPWRLLISPFSHYSPLGSTSFRIASATIPTAASRIAKARIHQASLTRRNLVLTRPSSRRST